MGKAQEKIRRLQAVLAHNEGDRVPAGEFFWTGFNLRCKKKWGNDFDFYKHFDLDYVVITPNMDPHIMPFEIIEQKGEDIMLRAGFGGVLKRSGTAPMPHYDSFSVNKPEEMADFEFVDSPCDSRRFYSAGDDQFNGIGDALNRNTPAWNDRVNAYNEDFAVFGSVCEPYEYIWRIVGTENSLLWMLEEPEAYKAFVDRIGAFLLEFTKAQIKAGKGRLSGMYIWGDIAYRNGMFLNPKLWREIFKPHVKELVNLCHSHGLMVVYHGCGNASPVYEDFVEMGVNAYNPLEVKSGLDVVKLKESFAGRLAFIGNVDVRVLESGDPLEIKKQVLYKLQASKGGGWIFQSDHSLSSDVEPESYMMALDVLREYGTYPLDMDRIKKELELLG